MKGVERLVRLIAICVAGLSLVAHSVSSGAAETNTSINWQADERAAFARAARDERFVLLYLEAVWCHWCHVMDQRTYADSDVAALIGARYVPLRIDQDSRPDLASRYRDYGWPATIVFDARGQEIVKRQGYIAPVAMRRLLQAIIDDPSPESVARVADPVGTVVSGLSPAIREALLARHRDTYDAQRGGLKTAQKYLERDSVEYALRRAAAGDPVEAERAEQTLHAALALLDPAWGGFYQYSTGGDWRHPHFEKLTVLQADYLRVYALAFAQTGDPRYREAVLSVWRYLDAFMADPEGAFYVSQDADLTPGEHSADYFALDAAARRALGQPRVDRQRYTQQTASVAESLATWFETSGDEAALRTAQRAVEWIMQHRSLEGGGFRHAEVDRGGPFLADTLAAGRAFLRLHQVTAERRWFDAAVAAADFIEQQFRLPAGYAGGVRSGSPIAPVARIEENIALARFANLLGRYSGAPRHALMASHARDWLAGPAVALSRITEAGILLVDEEIAGDPLHLTIIGGKDDAAAAALFAAALRLPGAYKRLEWWDGREGTLPNPDVRYPPVRRASAFVCTEQRCSLPITEPGEIADFVTLSARGD